MEADTGIPVKIESGVPLPDYRSGRYKFDEWAVGDSIFCETLERADSAQTAAKSWANRRGNGAVFTRRKVDDGWRLWRVA